jgi:hypothetical protein
VPGARTYAAARYLLELDGAAAGFLRSVEGGAVTADVVTGPGGDKHLGQVRYEELALQCDLSLGKAFYAWLGDTLAGKPVRHDVTVVTVDATGKSVARRECSQGVVAEIGLPALDGASKEPASLTVKVAPESTRDGKGTGAKPTLPAAKARKQWLSSSFTLDVDGLDCKKVAKIDAFAIRQMVRRDEVGVRRRPARETAQLEIPNLRITLAAAGGETWRTWFDDFVLKGSGAEREGLITFLAPDRKTPLGTVVLHNLGIFRLEPVPQTAGSEGVARLRADLYCERMELTIA